MKGGDISKETRSGASPGRMPARRRPKPTPDQPGGHSFRPARPSDARQVAELVDAAYLHYVERIGTTPGPLTDDYEEVIRNPPVDRKSTRLNSSHEWIAYAD